MIVLEVTKDRYFTLSVENTILEKPRGDHKDSPAFLGLKARHIRAVPKFSINPHCKGITVTLITMKIIIITFLKIQGQFK